VGRRSERDSERAIGRDIELGAGIAAGVLALLALALLLLAPLLPYCAVAARPCPTGAVRYTALAHAQLSAGAWALVLAPCAIVLAGAAGALAEARFRRRAGIIPLGIATALGLLLCVLGLSGVGIVYLPAILALALATYGAMLHRRRPRPPISGKSESLSPPNITPPPSEA
jgi:hypothetical protein